MPAFETPQPITATIDVVAGDVRIAARGGGETVVEVRPSDPADEQDVRAAERTRVEYAAGRLLVKAPKLRSWLPRGTGGSVDVTVELPERSRVRGTGQLADFRFEGALGDLDVKTGLGAIAIERAAALTLRTGIGDITVGSASGHAEIAAGSGDTRLAALEGTAVVKNSNGDTWVGEARGDLRVNAANGSIAVDAAHASVVAKSSNGDVRLGEAVRASVVLETRLGDVEVGIREGTAAWLDVRAGAGRVHNALEAAEPPGPAAETVEVRARTTAGSVLIRRAEETAA
jgi:DUF4097 and DUF4098 domain-containing protein YvlB